MSFSSPTDVQRPLLLSLSLSCILCPECPRQLEITWLNKWDELVKGQDGVLDAGHCVIVCDGCPCHVDNPITFQTAALLSHHSVFLQEGELDDTGGLQRKNANPVLVGHRLLIRPANQNTENALNGSPHLLRLPSCTSSYYLHLLLLRTSASLVFYSLMVESYSSDAYTLAPHFFKGLYKIKCVPILTSWVIFPHTTWSCMTYFVFRYLLLKYH